MTVRSIRRSPRQVAHDMESAGTSNHAVRGVEQ